MSFRVRSARLVLVFACVVAVTQLVSVPRGLADATGSDGHGKVRVGASTGASGIKYPVTQGSGSSTTGTGSMYLRAGSPVHGTRTRQRWTASR